MRVNTLNTSRVVTAVGNHDQKSLRVILSSNGQICPKSDNPTKIMYVAVKITVLWQLATLFLCFGKNKSVLR